MASSKNLFADLGAELVEETPPEADFSDLGAEAVDDVAELPQESDVVKVAQDLGAEPVEEVVKPGFRPFSFFEDILKGFQKTKERQDQLAQQQEANAAAQQQALAEQDADPATWSSTRFKKEAPKPRTPEEQALYDTILEGKKRREGFLKNRLLGGPEAKLEAGPEKKGFAGMVESLKKFYRPDMTKQQMIDEISLEYDLNPKEVQENFDELARMKAQKTGVYTQPTNEEFLNAVMVGALPLAVSISGPLAVAKGLAAYTGVKEGAERVILPAAKAVGQALASEPVQYEVTKFNELFPDVGPTRDIADLSEFVLYGIGAKRATEFFSEPKMVGELAGLRFRILRALGVKQETGLVPLTDAQIKEAFGDEAWKYLSKEGLEKFKTEEIAKRGPGTGEKPEVSVKPEPLSEAVAPEVLKEIGAEPVETKVERVTDPTRVQEIKNSIAEGEMILKGGKTISGRKMELAELDAIRRTIANAKAKIETPTTVGQDEAVKDIKTGIKESEVSAGKIKKTLMAELETALKSAKGEEELLGFTIPRGKTEGAGIRKAKVKLTEESKAKVKDLPRITISIPGDGTFTVLNTKEAISDLMRRVKSLETSAGPTEPAKPSQKVTARYKPDRPFFTMPSGAITDGTILAKGVELPKGAKLREGEPSTEQIEGVEKLLSVKSEGEAKLVQFESGEDKPGTEYGVSTEPIFTNVSEFEPAAPIRAVFETPKGDVFVDQNKVLFFTERFKSPKFYVAHGGETILVEQDGKRVGVIKTLVIEGGEKKGGWRQRIKRPEPPKKERVSPKVKEAPDEEPVESTARGGGGTAFRKPPSEKIKDLTFTPEKEGSGLHNIFNAAGEKVGQVGFLVRNGNAFIELLDIDGRYRGQGYGRAVIEKILNRPDVDVVTGQSASPSSDEFWKKIGAKSTGMGEFEIRKPKPSVGKTASGTAFSEPSTRTGKWQPKILPEEKIAKLHKFFGGMEYVKAMEMPELVRLARQLYGAPPQVVKRTGSALGRFIAARGRRSAMIKLVADMFKDPELAAGIIAHEIGHGIDWLPDYTLKRGNVLGRMASLHDFRKELLPDEPGGVGELTDKDKARLRREAEKQVGKPDAVETQFDPEAILGIFNTVAGAEKNPAVAEYIKRLNTEEKKSIVKAAMEAQRKGEKITIREVKQFNVDYAANKEKVQKIYEDLIREEIKKRKLFSEGVVREELKALTTWWHPFDPATVPPSYLQYRYSASELYAEFLSVLFNAPAKAQGMAPNFFRGFFNYLEAKPEVKQRFFEIQELLLDPAKVLSRREEDAVKMFKDNRATLANILANKAVAKKSIRFLLRYHFIDRNSAILDVRNKAAKVHPINPEDDPKYLLEENSMMGSFVKSHLEDFDKTYQAIRKSGLDFDKDFGQYLFLKRVMADRAEMANPLGQTPETAKRQIEAMKERLGKDRFDELEKYVGQTRDWFRKINNLLAEDVLNDSQKKMVQENTDYAPFRVTKYLKEYASAGFMKQIGTLSEIENPAVSLVFKGVAMLRLYKRNAIQKTIGNFLVGNAGGEAAKVKVFDGEVHVKAKEGFDIIKWRERGKWKAAYVDPYISDSFKYDDSGVLHSVGDVFRRILLNDVLFRPVYITFNLGFQSFNLVRDFGRYWKNTPELKFSDAVKKYIKAVPSAVRRARGKFDPLIQQMEREGALNITMNDMVMGQNAEDTEIEAVLTKYGMITPEKKPHPLLRPLFAVLDAIKFSGDVIETIPKVAGFNALINMPAKERAQYIRNYIGTPNFKKKGKMYPLYNNIFMFSNIIKEGIRSDYEAAFKNPRTRSGFWWKTIKMGILPKILMALAGFGAFGKALKDNYEKQTEYDKTNYTTLPLGEDERGKAMYLRIPMDETTRLISGIFWKTISRREPQNILAFTGGQVPSLSPMLEILTTWGQFLTGGNPRDNFRNQEILTQDEAKAGGMEAIEPMVRWTVNQTGLVHMDIRDRLKDETLLEKIIAFTPVVNRWVRISDYGKTESLRGTIEEQQKTEAKARLVEKDEIRTAIRQGKTAGQLAKELPYSERKNFIKKFEKERRKPTFDPVSRALSQTSSNEQKLKVLEEVSDDFKNTAAYRKELAGYYREKTISINVLNEAIRRFNKKRREGSDGK